MSFQTPHAVAPVWRDHWLRQPPCITPPPMWHFVSHNIQTGPETRQARTLCHTKQSYIAVAWSDPPPPPDSRVPENNKYGDSGWEILQFLTNSKSLFTNVEMSSSCPITILLELLPPPPRFQVVLLRVVGQNPLPVSLILSKLAFIHNLPVQMSKTPPPPPLDKSQTLSMGLATSSEMPEIIDAMLT